jgi:glycosyltransferase involved in cell wall biosynthesis
VIPRRGIDHPLKNTWAYRYSYNRLAKGVIANSNATKQSLLKNSPWLDPRKISVIYNGVDPNRFSGRPSADLRKEWQISKNAFLFGFVGQLDPRKGVETLLDAFKRLSKQEPGACLVLVGEGGLELKLRRMAQECRGRVVFAGYRDDVEDVMKTLDVLVLPSLWEGFGIVLIEAMAAGKPVITTNASNMPEIVTQGVDGVLIPPSDALALAQAMRSMVQSPILVRNMGTAGRSTVMRRFTLKKMVDAVESFFEEYTAI